MNRLFKNHTSVLAAFAAVVSVILPVTGGAAVWDESFPFPGKAVSAAKASHGTDAWALADNTIKAAFVLRDGALCLASLDNLLTGQTLVWSDRNLFTLRLGGGKSLTSSAMKRVAEPKLISLDGNRKLAKLAERFDGKALTAVFEDADTGLRVAWSAILRDGANALRQEIVVSSTKPAMVEDIEMLNAAVPGAQLVGYTDGSPVTAGNWFLGMEHPMAKTSVHPAGKAGDPPVVVSSLPRRFILEPGNSWTLSTGIGVAPQGLMRRAFAYYLQRERAHPYHQYWHYNSWYDLNINRNDNPDPIKRMNEAQCLDVIKQFDTELFQKRGVGLNGYVWDDGWDDWNSLWQFHKGFPNGFAKLAEAARPQGATMGAWLSPWGGYGHSHDARVRLGRAKGYETNAGGFSLGGEKYRAAFQDTCLKMIRDYGQGYFKFDGIGGGMYATGASPAIAPDLDGLVRILCALRRENPNVFINCTVGTWASPYWTWFADSVWRQGADSDFSGKGNNRERWINYKDTLVYNRFVANSPLFPVNSLMYHGLLVGPTATPGQMPSPAKDPVSFRHEMRMTVGYASGLGELYVTPSLMTPEAWDCMAECIGWARAHKSLVADAHWIGGNPGKHEVYGFAAWNPRDGGVLTLRNPDDKPQAITLTLAVIFEMPAGSSQGMTLTSPWKDEASRTPVKAQADQPLTLTLQPFEVVTLQAKR